jgi:putative toxin-antitoxin system antitoxin component (TIGR02293 family)
MPSLATTHDGSLLYRRVVSDTRAALSISEIAEVTGVQPRSVQNWAAGATKPEGEQRERLLELSYVVGQLADVYEPEGVEIWLHSPQRALRHRKPVDALRAGDFTQVLDLIDRLAGGPRR